MRQILAFALFCQEKGAGGTGTLNSRLRDMKRLHARSPANPVSFYCATLDLAHRLLSGRISPKSRAI